MIFEVVELEIKSGAEAAFEAAVAEAAPHFRSAKGCRSMDLQHVIEDPSRYRLVIGWDTVEDHMVTFRNSDGFHAWRALASPHFAAPPQLVHVAKVATLF